MSDEEDVLFGSNKRPRTGDGKPTIRLVDFELMKTMGELPRFPDDAHVTLELEHVDRDNAVIFFISHSWLRGWPGAEGWNGRPHADNATHDKFTLIKEAVQRAWRYLASGMNRCYVWIDYSCQNQDNAEDCLHVSGLDRIMAICDAMITPIVDKKCDEWELLPGTHDQLWTTYQAEAFQDPIWGYQNRCWCRIEMQLAGNVDLQDSAAAGHSNRISKFKFGLRAAALANRRPHLLFGTKELTNGDPTYLPHFLSSFQNAYFEERDPTKGQITKEEDREVIKGLAAKYPVKNAVVGYIGQRDHVTGKKHGHGKEELANGDSYDGHYKNGLREGHGKETTSYGDFYEGSFIADKRSGQGILTYAAGETYDGTFADDMLNGPGTMSYPDGSVYDGNYENNLMHGYGVFTYSDGSRYEGEFAQGKIEGRGKLFKSGGSLHKDGLWKDNRPVTSVRLSKILRNHEASRSTVCPTFDVIKGEIEGHLPGQNSSNSRLTLLIGSLRSALGISSVDSTDEIPIGAIDALLENLKPEHIEKDFFLTLLDDLESVRELVLNRAYAYALSKGSRPWRRSRLMILGEGRAGKSSLLRALTGKPFIPDLPSTPGVSVLDCESQDAGVLIDECVTKDNWRECEKDQLEVKRTLLEQVSIEARKGQNLIIKERLTSSSLVPQHKEQPKRKHREALVEEFKAPEQDVLDVENAPVFAEPLPSLSSEKDEVQQKGDFEFSPSSITCDDPCITFTIFDYGGQRCFQCLQHVLLSQKGVYVLCFDMVKLSSPDEAIKANALGFIRFWLRQVALQAKDAPVLLVGTHKDVVQEEARHASISAFLDANLSPENESTHALWTGGSLKRNDPLCFFPIDNKQALGPDLTLGVLKKRIEKEVEDDPLKYVNKEMPTSWLAFCDELRLMSRQGGVKYLKRQGKAKALGGGGGGGGGGDDGGDEEGRISVMDLARKHGAFQSHLSEEEQLSSLLTTLHDLGFIIYYEEPQLRDMVILDPQWLIDSLVAIIRDFRLHRLKMDHILFSSKPNEWLLLRKFGILSSLMLPQFWLGNDNANKKFLISMMEQLELLCPIEAGASYDPDNDEVEVKFIVPSVISAFDEAQAVNKAVEELGLSVAACASASFTCTFDKFLPEAFLSRLVVALVRTNSVHAYPTSTASLILPSHNDQTLTPPCLFNNVDDGSVSACVVVAGVILLIRESRCDERAIELLLLSAVPSSYDGREVTRQVIAAAEGINQAFYNSSLCFTFTELSAIQDVSHLSKAPVVQAVEVLSQEDIRKRALDAMLQHENIKSAAPSKIRDLFRSIDGNGDGLVDVNDFIHACGSGINEQESRLLFDQLDTSRCGRLSCNDFVNGFAIAGGGGGSGCASPGGGGSRSISSRSTKRTSIELFASFFIEQKLSRDEAEAYAQSIVECGYSGENCFDLFMSDAAEDNEGKEKWDAKFLIDVCPSLASNRVHARHIMSALQKIKDNNQLFVCVLCDHSTSSKMEAEAIVGAISFSGKRPLIESYTAVTSSSHSQSKMLANQYTVLHLASREAPLPQSAVDLSKAIVSSSCTSLECVVLNCEKSAADGGLASQIKELEAAAATGERGGRRSTETRPLCVIGWQGTVDSEALKAFTESFYLSLRYQQSSMRSYQSAFDNAKIALKLRSMNCEFDPDDADALAMLRRDDPKATIVGIPLMEVRDAPSPRTLTRKGGGVAIGGGGGGGGGALLSDPFNVFISHEWGEEKDEFPTHVKAKRIYEKLTALGLKCWFDDVCLRGNDGLSQKFCQGIDDSTVFLSLVTPGYIAKVAGNNTANNCQVEFNYANYHKNGQHGCQMLACVIDESCITTKWKGPVGMCLGMSLYVKCTDFDNEVVFDAAMDKLRDAIRNVQSKYEESVLATATVVAVATPTNTSSSGDVGMEVEAGGGEGELTTARSDKEEEAQAEEEEGDSKRRRKDAYVGAQQHAGPTDNLETAWQILSQPDVNIKEECSADFNKLVKDIVGNRPLVKDDLNNMDEEDVTAFAAMMPKHTKKTFKQAWTATAATVKVATLPAFSTSITASSSSSSSSASSQSSSSLMMSSSSSSSSSTTSAAAKSDQRGVQDTLSEMPAAKKAKQSHAEEAAIAPPSSTTAVHSSSSSAAISTTHRGGGGDDGMEIAEGVEEAGVTKDES